MCRMHDLQKNNWNVKWEEVVDKRSGHVRVLTSTDTLQACEMQYVTTAPSPWISRRAERNAETQQEGKNPES